MLPRGCRHHPSTDAGREDRDQPHQPVHPTKTPPAHIILLQAAASEAGSGSPRHNKQTAGSSGEEVSGIDPLPLLLPSVSDNGIDQEAVDILFPQPPGLCISSHRASFPICRVSDAAADAVTRRRAVLKPISKSFYPILAREAYQHGFILFAPIFSYRAD